MQFTKKRQFNIKSYKETILPWYQMNIKIILAIVIILALVFGIANMALDYYTEPEFYEPSTMCRDLMYDADVTMWVPIDNSFVEGINECDEEFKRCYDLAGNDYAEFVQCYSP